MCSMQKWPFERKNCSNCVRGGTENCFAFSARNFFAKSASAENPTGGKIDEHKKKGFHRLIFGGFLESEGGNNFHRFRHWFRGFSLISLCAFGLKCARWNLIGKLEKSNGWMKFGFHQKVKCWTFIGSWIAGTWPRFCGDCSLLVSVRISWMGNEVIVLVLFQQVIETSNR